MFSHANISRFLFSCPSLQEALRVVGFAAEQGLSSLYWCELELACDRSALDLNTLVGKSGVLTLFDAVHPGFIHGEITAASQGAVGRRFTTYHVTLRPKIWQLELRRGSRIFQQLSVPDIIQQVLKDAGISGDDLQLKLSGHYPVLDYCTQYRETDFAFLDRLMAEAGLFYYFEHSVQRHVLVIADDKQVFTPINGNHELPYRQSTAMVSAEESVMEFQVQHNLCAGAVALRDYLFEKPGLLLEAENRNPMFSALEHYDYPGFFADGSAGKRRAEMLLQSRRVNQQVVSGRSDSTRLTVGRRFTLAFHPRPDFNADYTITRVRLQGRQPQSLEEGATAEGSSFALDFHAMPAASDYRPLATNPRPRIEGVQTAFVTGPKGEEIYTDQFGRIKVQFHWDREGKHDEHSSCWLRLQQSWAGNHWGSLVLPCIGQEVLVTFLDGDPDRPLVTGALYNATTAPPYDLPANKTRTGFKSQSSPGGGGFNELRIEDKKGSEQLFLHGERDANLVVKNDWHEMVDHDTHRIVQQNAYESVQKDQHLEVGANLNIKVGKTRSETIGQDLQVKVGGNQLHQVSNALNLKGGSGVVLEAGLSITLRGGGGKIVLDPSGVAIVGSMVRINSGGGAGSAQVSAPVAPRLADTVEPGKPGNPIQFGRTNRLHHGQPIPFGSGVAHRVSLAPTKDSSVRTPASSLPRNLSPTAGKPVLSLPPAARMVAGSPESRAATITPSALNAVVDLSSTPGSGAVEGRLHSQDSTPEPEPEFFVFSE